MGCGFIWWGAGDLRVMIIEFEVMIILVVEVVTVIGAVMVVIVMVICVEVICVEVIVVIGLTNTID